MTAREHEARLLLEDVSRQFASNSSSGYPNSGSYFHILLGLPLKHCAGSQQPQSQQQQQQPQGYPSFGASRPSAPEF